MGVKEEIESRDLERRAAEFENRVGELDIEAHVHFRPGIPAFWEESDSADRHRTRA